MKTLIPVAHTGTTAHTIEIDHVLPMSDAWLTLNSPAPDGKMWSNGELVDGLRSKVRKGTQVASGSIVGHIPLVTNDYVELWITNTTSSQNPVVSDATFALMN